MVLNYRPANYIGWPIPAFNYGTKVRKIIENTKCFGN